VSWRKVAQVNSLLPKNIDWTVLNGGGISWQAHAPVTPNASIGCPLPHDDLLHCRATGPQSRLHSA
jgi:hypothetical protein